MRENAVLRHKTNPLFLRLQGIKITHHFNDWKTLTSAALNLYWATPGPLSLFVIDSQFHSDFLRLRIY